MKTIAFVTQKGGAGKTTLTTSVAVAAAEAGERVVALDLDPQRSLVSWYDRRQETGGPQVDQVADIPQLPTILARLQAHGITLVILDCPGHFSVAQNTALGSIDLALVPSRPTTLDLQAAVPTVHALARFGRPILFTLNQCLPGSNSRAREAAAGLSGLGMLADPIIIQRTDYQDAIATGKGVTEYAPRGKAADEIRGLWRCIYGTLAPRQELVA